MVSSTRVAALPVQLSTRVLPALTWTLAGLWALSSLWFPFGWDQGILAWVGDTILQGGMPYRDAFDLKGPVAFYIFALSEFMFGHNLWGIRLLDLLLCVFLSLAVRSVLVLLVSVAPIWGVEQAGIAESVDVIGLLSRWDVIRTIQVTTAGAPASGQFHQTNQSGTGRDHPRLNCVSNRGTVNCP